MADGEHVSVMQLARDRMPGCDSVPHLELLGDVRRQLCSGAQLLVGLSDMLPPSLQLQALLQDIRQD